MGPASEKTHAAKRTVAILVMIALAWLVPAVASSNAIVFTANQEFLSRIYVLRMDGTVEWSIFRGSSSWRLTAV